MISKHVQQNVQVGLIDDRKIFPQNITDDTIDETKRNRGFIQVNLIISQLIPVFYVNWLSKYVLYILSHFCIVK